MCNIMIDVPDDTCNVDGTHSNSNKRRHKCAVMNEMGFNSELHGHMPRQLRASQRKLANKRPQVAKHRWRKMGSAGMNLRKLRQDARRVRRRQLEATKGPPANGQRG